MLTEAMVVKALETFPNEKAFHFFTSVGNYTGESAASLKEFTGKINLVDVRSLEFHQKRGDFEKWIREVLGDVDLARDVRNISRLNLSGEALRRQLYATVSNRLRVLEGQLRSARKV